MKVLFDNNLSPHLAHAIRELSKSEPGISNVVHLRDGFEGNTPDLVWISELPGRWVIISIDAFAKQQGAERVALGRAGHLVFVLEPKWSQKTFWLKSERLVRWWPQILAEARVASAGIVRVPWDSHGRLQVQKWKA